MKAPEVRGASTDNIGGFDFGLKAFLTDHEGKRYHSIARLNREVSRKEKGSNNHSRAKWRLAKAHQRVADKRRDAHWKLAHALCSAFEIICLERLNIEGMKRLWGRQVSDLGFAEFVGILEQVAARTGREVVHIDRWLPTSKSCAACVGTRNLGA